MSVCEHDNSKTIRTTGMKFAGRLNREYRAAQSKGLPYPILWAVEYFTVDEGNFRYGRYYRLAGWYCHIAM
ncbi:hypothetical protein AVEN_242383-1, partial [Araneus ventricosus]